MKCKTLQLFGENTEDMVPNLVFGKEFFTMTQKSQGIREKDRINWTA